MFIAAWLAVASILQHQSEKIIYYLIQVNYLIPENLLNNLYYIHTTDCPFIQQAMESDSTEEHINKSNKKIKVSYNNLYQIDNISIYTIITVE